MSNFETPYTTLAEIANLEDNLQIKLKHAAAAEKWTAEEIAAGLGTTVKTIATQKTYLSWQDIIVQKRENGVLYIADAEEAAEIKTKRAERKKKGPAGTAADPVKLTKLANERLAKYKANIAELEALNEFTENQEDELALLKARVVIEEIRLKRLNMTSVSNDADDNADDNADDDGVEREENEHEVSGSGDDANDADDLL
jgi:hypothetical protein